MKKMVYISCLLLGAASAWAATASDDFNRNNTNWSADGSLIGADWNYDSGLNGNWKINGNRVDVQNGTASTVLYNDALQTTSGNGTTFTASLDVMVNSNSAWSGLAFNAQDSTHFYYMRIRGNDTDNVQIGRIGTSEGIFGNKHAISNLVSGMDYTLTVSSSIPYVFDCQIKETASGTVLFSGTFEDTSSVFTGGYAGIYQGTAALGTTVSSYDNFDLEIKASTPLIKDDFTRPDTGLNAGNDFVDPGWKNSKVGSSQWGVENQRVVANLASVDANTVLYNALLETVSGNGTNFTASLDVNIAGSYWAGMAFHYQNPTNFYYLRYKGDATNYQMYRMVDGISSTLLNLTLPGGTFASGTDYTLTVISSNAYEFAYEIKETGSGTVMASGSVTDSLSSFSGGYAGILQTSVGLGCATYDNFSLESGAEALSGYAAWAAGWLADIGAEDEDYDSDGLLNLYEYGLGGDPTDPLDQGVAPELFFGGGAMGYIYPQLSDINSGLTYTLELNPDLVSGIWAATGYTVSGTNVTGGDLDFVTNVTDTVADEKFLRLMIEN